MINSVVDGSQIKVFKNAYRNFIDVTDLTLIVEQLIVSTTINQIIDLLHPVSYSMVEVMEHIEMHVSKETNSIYLEEGYNYFPKSTETIKTLFKRNNICSDKSYLSKILKKYY